MHARTLFPFRMASVAAAGAMLCAGTALAQTGGTSQERLQAERAKCERGDTQQSRADCLREVGAAAQEARRGGLTTQGQSDYRANAAARCDLLPPERRSDCMALRGDDVQIQGSVEGGAILRQTTIRTVGEPQPVSAPAAGGMAPAAGQPMPAPGGQMPPAGGSPGMAPPAGQPMPAPGAQTPPGGTMAPGMTPPPGQTSPAPGMAPPPGQTYPAPGMTPAPAPMPPTAPPPPTPGTGMAPGSGMAPPAGGGGTGAVPPPTPGVTGGAPGMGTTPPAGTGMGTTPQPGTGMNTTPPAGTGMGTGTGMR